MKPQSTLGLAALLTVLLPTPLAARTVLVDTATPFTEGAAEVQIDYTSVQGWDRYQAGAIGEWHYRIDPDGSAVFAQDPRMTEGRRQITCTADGCTEGPAQTPITPNARLDPQDPVPAYAAWVMAGATAPASTAPIEPPILTEAPELRVIPATLARWLEAVGFCVQPGDGLADQVNTALQFANDAPSPLRTSQQIEALQAALTALGQDPRGIDGIIGPGTRRAVEGFRSALGLLSGGPPNQADLEIALLALSCRLIQPA